MEHPGNWKQQVEIAVGAMDLNAIEARTLCVWAARRNRSIMA
jgi:hypothetical protein